MKISQWLFCFICILFINGGEAYPDTEIKKTIILSTAPNGASIFHYFQGKYHFLGYTPVELSQGNLKGKSKPKILLNKLGYRENSFELNFNQINKKYNLTLEKSNYLIEAQKNKTTFTACKIKTQQIIETLIDNHSNSQLAFQLPFQWIDDDSNTKLIIIGKILNQAHIRAIKKEGRRHRNKVSEYVAKLIGSETKHFVDGLKNLKCLNNLLIIAVYENKGLKIDFTPYESYWNASSSYRVGDSIITNFASGSTIEFKSDMVVSKKSKSFLFEYKLN